ncbi:MAG: glycerophosphodiester phosphodiesterase, partial [Candidatus Accumulibacter sp.]|nr:glycerophosphodiester phosphodiesterase [Accumulibacter sp.]
MKRLLSIFAFLVCFPLTVAAAGYAPAIASHRGASGYLPEHTLEAKAMAYALGVDYVE